MSDLPKSNDKLVLEPQLGPKWPDSFASPLSPTSLLSTSYKQLRTSADSLM